jgi:hypothetical protein
LSMVESTAVEMEGKRPHNAFSCAKNLPRDCDA